MPTPMDAWRPGRGGLSPMRERLREWTLSGLLILEVFVLFVAAPIGATYDVQAPLLAGNVLILAVIVAIVIISRGVSARILATVAVMLAVVGGYVRITNPSPVTIWFGHFASIMGVAALSIVVAGGVFGPGRVTHHRIQGAIVLYLNIAIAFTSAYRLALEQNPEAFSGVPAGLTEAAAFDTMLYFSFTTLTSTGYGEVYAISPVTRSLANLEAIIGQLYLAILLARLVTQHVESRNK